MSRKKTYPESAINCAAAFGCLIEAIGGLSTGATTQLFAGLDIQDGKQKDKMYYAGFEQGLKAFAVIAENTINGAIEELFPDFAGIMESDKDKVYKMAQDTLEKMPGISLEDLKNNNDGGGVHD